MDHHVLPRVIEEHNRLIGRAIELARQYSPFGGSTLGGLEPLEYDPAQIIYQWQTCLLDLGLLSTTMRAAAGSAGIGLYD